MPVFPGNPGNSGISFRSQASGLAFLRVLRGHRGATGSPRVLPYRSITSWRISPCRSHTFLPGPTSQPPPGRIATVKGKLRWILFHPPFLPPGRNCHFWARSLYLNYIYLIGRLSFASSLALTLSLSKRFINARSSFNAGKFLEANRLLEGQIKICQTRAQMFDTLKNSVRNLTRRESAAKRDSK